MPGVELRYHVHHDCGSRIDNTRLYGETRHTSKPDGEPQQAGHQQDPSCPCVTPGVAVTTVAPFPAGSWTKKKNKQPQTFKFVSEKTRRALATLTCARQHHLGSDHRRRVLGDVTRLGGRVQVQARTGAVHHLLIGLEGGLSVHGDRVVGRRELVLGGEQKAVEPLRLETRGYF